MDSLLSMQRYHVPRDGSSTKRPGGLSSPMVMEAVPLPVSMSALTAEICEWFREGLVHTS
jgi:hypothetical protein